MKGDADLRRHIVNLLTKGEAHLEALAELRRFPRELRGRKPRGAPHTPWELLEHMRIAQWDIVQFSMDAKHTSPKWPDEYWPKAPKPPNARAWAKSVKQFAGDRETMCRLVHAGDLLKRIPHGAGQTLLREALLAADHNAYHLGELVMLRRTMQRH